MKNPKTILRFAATLAVGHALLSTLAQIAGIMPVASADGWNCLKSAPLHNAILAAAALSFLLGRHWRDRHAGTVIIAFDALWMSCLALVATCGIMSAIEVVWPFYRPLLFGDVAGFLRGIPTDEASQAALFERSSAGLTTGTVAVFVAYMEAKRSARRALATLARRAGELLLPQKSLRDGIVGA